MHYLYNPQPSNKKIKKGQQITMDSWTLRIKGEATPQDVDRIRNAQARKNMKLKKGD